MARPKNIRPGPGRPKERLKIIIEYLERSPGTFEKLLDRIPLARATLSEGLVELENQGSIEHRIEPPKERGRGIRHQVIIQLSERELHPVAKTLRHLENITATPKIDAKKGKALLTGDVVDAALVISTLSRCKFTRTPKTPECPHPARFECYKEREGIIKETMSKLRTPPPNPFKKLEIDEHHLLRALARFYVELCFFDTLKRKDCDSRLSYILTLDLPKKLTTNEDLARFNQKMEIVQLLKRRKDPEMFPAFGVAKRTGTLKQFKDILDWIRPLLEFPEASAESLEDFAWMSIVGRVQIGLPSWNLAGEVFRQEVSNYFGDMLFPLWLNCAPHSRGGKAKEKEGGEKS